MSFVTLGLDACGFHHESSSLRDWLTSALDHLQKPATMREEPWLENAIFVDLDPRAVEHTILHGCGRGGAIRSVYLTSKRYASLEGQDGVELVLGVEKAEGEGA